MICPFHFIGLKVRVIDVYIKNSTKYSMTSEEWEIYKDNLHRWNDKSPLCTGNDRIYVCPKCAYATKQR